MSNNQPTPHPLKAVILAAGAKSITEDGLPVLLQDLAGKKIIDYVTANTAQVAAPVPGGPSCKRKRYCRSSWSKPL